MGQAASNLHDAAGIRPDPSKIKTYGVKPMKGFVDLLRGAKQHDGEARSANNPAHEGLPVGPTHLRLNAAACLSAVPVPGLKTSTACLPRAGKV